MKRKASQFGFTPAEHRVSALPSTIAGMLVLVLVVLGGGFLWPKSAMQAILAVAAGVLGIAYLGFFNWLLIPSGAFRRTHAWLNAVLTSLGLMILAYATVDGMDLYLGSLLILAVIGSAIIAERGPSYLMIVLATAGTILIRSGLAIDLREWTFHLSIALISAIVVETVKQLQRQSRNHIRRLETMMGYLVTGCAAGEGRFAARRTTFQARITGSPATGTSVRPSRRSRHAASQGIARRIADSSRA